MLVGSSSLSSLSGCSSGKYTFPVSLKQQIHIVCTNKYDKKAKKNCP